MQCEHEIVKLQLEIYKELNKEEDAPQEETKDTGHPDRVQD